MTAVAAPRRIRLGARAMSGLALGYAILILLAVIYIYPFLVSVAGSFTQVPSGTRPGSASAARNKLRPSGNVGTVSSPRGCRGRAAPGSRRR